MVAAGRSPHVTAREAKQGERGVIPDGSLHFITLIRIIEGHRVSANSRPRGRRGKVSGVGVGGGHAISLQGSSLTGLAPSQVGSCGFKYVSCPTGTPSGW